MMNKIPVLYVEENQDGTTGGSHYCLLDLVKAIDKKRFEIHVMFYEHNRLIDEFKKESVVHVYNKPSVVYLVKGGNNTRHVFFTKARIILKPVQFLINIYRTNLLPISFFFFFILKNKIQLIHLNNTVFTFFDWLIAAKLTRRKIVVHQRTHLYRISKWLKHCHKFYDYIFGISKYTKSYLIKNNVDISKHTTIYDTINVDVFKKKLCKSKRTTRSGFGVNETQPLIGIIGNIRDWKGQSIVIDAVEILKKKFPDLVCLLVGDMSDDCEDFNSGIRDKIIQKGLTQNIIITGFRTDIADIQNALDVFIHASLSPEPYGLVVLEAMVMGTAIVASNEGGPSEMIVDGKSGFLIPPGDPEILADKIDWFLSDVTLRERMGALAQKRFYERFSTFDIKTIETIYLRLLKS